jgi:predicted site-specific integrase-resolvase
VSIVTSFCARLYSQRRSKRKTERLIAELTQPPTASVSSPGE